VSGPVDALVRFARTLRHAGVAATPDRVLTMIAALEHLDILNPAHVYWAGRVALCSSPDELDRYDVAFAAYFGPLAIPSPSGAPGMPVVRVSAASSPEPTFGIDRPWEGERDEDQPAQAATPQASRRESLRNRDLATLSAAERAELRALFALLQPRVGRRRTRRYQPDRHGRVDPARTIRTMVARGGEPTRLDRRRRREAPRRLVMLVDVSGSMTPYADALLRFAHAATRVAPGRTEVFTIGTRLTRISRELRLRDPDDALAAANRAIPDWSGGTRLGDMLKAFLDLWGQRGVARGAVVIVGSDGWERGDPTLLREQAQRLARLAHRVIWVNPHKGRTGFSPETGGMIAVLPHIDALVAGHTFATLSELAGLIAAA
jgi:uncharacterized protein with von Willebrand factor type A (vWA) domain